MNLEPSIWGPHYWATFHFISSTYDDNPNLSVQTTMKNFIQSIPVFLPCKECQDHAFNFINESNLNKAVSSRRNLFTFFFNFHNKVNERLNKPLMSIHDALKMYHAPKDQHHLYSSTNTSTHKTSEMWLILILILILIGWFGCIKKFK